MHSHEKTYLASLGFNDPDKSDPLHDCACQYLTGDVYVHEKIARMVSKKELASDFTYEVRDKRYGKKFYRSELSLDSTHMEVPVNKGTGQYLQLVGFMDVVLRHHIDGIFISGSEPGVDDDWSIIKDYAVCVEVKTGKLTASAIIRQVNLYGQHLYFQSKAHGAVTVVWIVATTWKPSPADMRSFDQANITHLLLGDGFSDYVQKQKSVDVNSSTFISV